jgi:DNA-binding YbaB/EbfC family protein
MGTGFLRQKKQAKQMQSQMAKLQQTLSQEMEIAEVEGVSGQNLVKVTLSGTGELKRIKIQPECVDPEDVEGLETLIKQAFQEAHKKVEELAESSSHLSGMQSLLGM